jgi:hypothetical protein
MGWVMLDESVHEVDGKLWGIVVGLAGGYGCPG